MSSLSNVGGHMKDYAGDIIDRNITTPIKEKDPIGMVTGAVGTAASIILEAPDQLYDAVLGREYQAPAGLAGRVTRDTRLFLQDVVGFHPFAALGDVWRLGTSSIPLDVIDGVGGHTRSNNYSTAA